LSRISSKPHGQFHLRAKKTGTGTTRQLKKPLPRITRCLNPLLINIGYWSGNCPRGEKSIHRKMEMNPKLYYIGHLCPGFGLLVLLPGDNIRITGVRYRTRAAFPEESRPKHSPAGIDDILPDKLVTGLIDQTCLVLPTKLRNRHMFLCPTQTHKGLCLVKSIRLRQNLLVYSARKNSIFEICHPQISSRNSRKHNIRNLHNPPSILN